MPPPTRLPLDEQMDEELRSHIEMQTQENVGFGMEPEEARYAALRQFGWVESIKEECRDQRGMVWLEDLAQDLRFGARMLRKNPGFTAIVLLTLALGIGAVSSVFSLACGVLLTMAAQVLRWLAPKLEQAAVRTRLRAFASSSIFKLERCASWVPLRPTAPSWAKPSH